MAGRAETKISQKSTAGGLLHPVIDQEQLLSSSSTSHCGRVE
jgi:hypothetical protein